MHRTVKRNRPVPLYYDQTIYDDAVERGKQMGRLNHSITQGKSNHWGFIGEALVACWTDGDIVDDYDFDIRTKLGTKLEVKTKKTTRLDAPLPHYECSVCNYNTKQRADYYVFVRVCTLYEQTKNPEHARAWICGYKAKDAFAAESVFFKKGDVDPSNHYKVHADCHNMAIDNLQPLPCFTTKYV